MAGMAKVTILGNLGQDPTTRYTPNGKMNVSMSVAVGRRDREGNDSTAWYRVTCWGRTAEWIDTMTQQGAIAKGRQVFIAGTLEPREYTAKDGSQRMSLDVNADDVQLIGPRPDGGDRPEASNEPPF